ncbi:transcriptional regulator family: Fungal Specific TF [Penicillium roqueforti]|uniref:Zn(2)-C6 fungal-type DNA-binding domain n=1 Tax=Penicillium roqueforti (strain FM164) TaxID=1365484 RepID=W6QID4_PENRF|nr:transcriptional regulator family: Fungal Specific TF [Penicillium roqueforti]CDM33964.1 Zn(2)-C6 fungal-type DNA-binding domain [Penicillium roqueforti FM164]KAI2749884.1 transcriptional regulator family: Fungal Specific TF [Penicillium roqueforti]KAI2766494.1 transcriptional regulator family: Fungal Specific TF [Penicillium roqueforti]KAI3075160.1 transcriptional regulator family: Fungal Specific TF [Penicillium roqueforti]
MATTTSPLSGENEEDPAPMTDLKYSHDDDHHDTPTPDATIMDSKSLPAQKRRRVGRACDECRRKKIKCDGKQPCTHCTVYSYDCSYDQPSNRRRNPAPQYVEALENRLQKAEALLRIVLPNVDLDDPQLDLHATEQKFTAAQKSKATEDVRPSGALDPAQEGADEGLLETMVDNSGCLDRDDQGHWDYHGHTSGVLFVRRLRKQLGAADITAPMARSRPSISAHMMDSPKSVSESPQDSTLPPTHDLPPRAAARRLCHNAIDHACSLMKFVHIPSFFASLERIYDTPPEQFTNQDHSFLPLLYIAIAVGCLFSDDESGQGTLDLAGYEGAIGQGFQFFKAGRQLLEITDCRDLVSLQAICFMVLFLQSSAKLSTCYSYVGIALRSALRLGLHRSVAADFNPLERELRKRIFWVVRKMDIYVSTLLGLPQILSDDDIDQEYPMEVDGDFITSEGITQPPSNYTPLMAGCNAHTRLSNIILKVVKYIYPVKNARYRSKSDQRYMVSHSKIREIERDLQNWMEELPPALRPGTEVSPQLERVRQLLRISYAHVQMVMYRPFLHYVTGGSQARGVDKRSYACAAACVSVSRNIVHITTGMQKRGLLNGSFWFTMYTTYFAILSLIFFVLENPDSPTAKDGVLKDAMEGKNTLAGLAKKSLAADRCSQSLNCLFKTLPEMLKNRQSSKTPVNLKRPAPSNTAEPEPNNAEPQPKPSFEKTLPVRSSTFPVQMMSQPAVADDQNRRQRSVDNVQPVTNRPAADIHHQSTWISTTPDLLTETMTTPEHISSSSMTSSMPNQEPSSLAWAQQFTNPSNLPDLMPMMFPSDDPFAYPTQPMSTLEDAHFRHDPAGMPSQYSFDSAPGMGPTTPVDPSSAGGTPTFDFKNIPNYPITNSAGMKSSVPSHLRPSHSRTSSRVHSPISQSQTPTDASSSSDLVSIPNQNFVWKGYNFQANIATDMAPETAPQQQEMPAPNGLPPFSMGIDENIGMNMDLGITFDDLFGNNAAYRPGSGASAEDWAQWMNANSI